jgi:hypothetical protein
MLCCGSCAVSLQNGLNCVLLLQDASSDSSAGHRRRQKAAGVVALSSSRVTAGAPTATLQQLQITIHAPLVVASCGSIHTPALLLRSGVKAGGNVGRHLRLHPAAGLVGYFEPTAEQKAAGQGAVDMYKVRFCMLAAVVRVCLLGIIACSFWLSYSCISVAGICTFAACLNICSPPASQACSA